MSGNTKATDRFTQKLYKRMTYEEKMKAELRLSPLFAGSNAAPHKV